MRMSREDAKREIEAIEERARQNNGRVSLSDRIQYEWLIQVVAALGLESCKAAKRQDSKRS